MAQPARSSSDTKILPIHPRQDEDLEGKNAKVVRPGGWLSTWLGSPPISHEVKGQLEGAPTTPILRGRKRSPWLLTTYMG